MRKEKKNKLKKEAERISFATENNTYCMFCSKPLHPDYDHMISPATDYYAHLSCWKKSGRKSFWVE